MSLSLIEIWNFSKDTADASLKQLTDAGYQIKTKSENVYIQIISALTSYRHSFFDDINNEIVADNFFLRMLEDAEKDGLSHFDILIRGLQRSDNGDLKRVLKLQEKVKRTTLLENTYESKPEEICTMDSNDGSNFYFTNPKTGKKELLKAHHLFQYQNHCFDIDTIFKYVNEGGKIKLDSDYVKRFFNRFGVVDFSGTKLTTEGLRKKTYHEGVRTLNLNNNNITSLRDTHIPKTVTMLTVDNNPLRGNYFLNEETPNLMFLSMKDCGLDKIDFEYLPQSLTVLELNNNPKLTNLHSLRILRNLRKLDIRKTGIKKIDWSKFVTLNPDKQLTVYCDSDVQFKKNKPDWITVI